MAAQYATNRWPRTIAQPQLPFTQLWPARHGLPQPPQFFGSTSTFTQALPQELVPPPQPQAPFRQEAPAPQVLPHAPQLAGSMLVSAHVVVHNGSPEGQTQLPAWQC